MSTERPAAGRIVWREIMSTSPKASIAFLTELFGWKTKDHDMGPMGTYTMFFVGEKGVGGLMALDASIGAPSHWLAYITVDDVDASAKRIPELGGKVLHAPGDIPSVGRFSVIQDAQGGVTALFKPTGSEPEDTGMPGPGMFCWEELMSTDPAAAVNFYTSVYGWRTEEKDMGPMGTYTLCYRGDQQIAGIMGIPPGAPPITYWANYVVVNDVDESAERAKRLGGTILSPPMDIPNVGRFSMVADPSGAPIALFKSADKSADKSAS